MLSSACFNVSVKSFKEDSPSQKGACNFPRRVSAEGHTIVTQEEAMGVGGAMGGRKGKAQNLRNCIHEK